jgi:hypothetical protein
MPKVPLSDGQISTKQVNYNPIQEGVLNQGIVGSDVAQAQNNLNSNINKATGMASDYFTNEMKIQSEKRIADAETSLRGKMSNLLIDPEIENGKPKGLLNRELDHAQGIAQEFNTSSQDLIDKHIQDLNSYEQGELKKSITNYKESLFNKVVSHQADQKDKVETNSFNNYQASLIDGAALYSDDNKLSDDIASAIIKNADFLGLKGNSPETIEQRNKELADKIIHSNITAKLEHDPAGALVTLEKNKDILSGEFYAKTKQVIDGKNFIDMQTNMWDKTFSKITLADGNIDQARTTRLINGMDTLNNAKKEKLIDYVKSKAAELRQNKIQQDSARLDGFHNDIATALKQGATLDDAMKYVGKRGGDAYEKQTQEEYVRKAFDKPIKTNPEIYLKTWEGVQDGTTTKEDIGKEWKAGNISNSDFESLNKELYKQQLTGEGNKSFQRIKLLADEKFPNRSDKTSKAEFLYELKNSTKNMKPEEAYAYAQDALKDEVVAKRSYWFDKTEPKYKVDLEKRDANSSAWGMLYNDVGSKEVETMGRDLAKYGKKNVNIDDINNAVNSLGGYSAVKKGTPAHNAIQSLMSKGKPVIPENIQYVLKRHPDGKY